MAAAAVRRALSVLGNVYDCNNTVLNNIIIGMQGLVNITLMFTAERNIRGTSIAARDVIFLVTDSLAAIVFACELRKRFVWASMRSKVLLGTAGCVVAMKLALWLIRAAASEVV